MAEQKSIESLLARISGKANDGGASVAAINTSEPAHKPAAPQAPPQHSAPPSAPATPPPTQAPVAQQASPPAPTSKEKEQELDGLLKRINNIATSGEAPPEPAPIAKEIVAAASNSTKSDSATDTDENTFLPQEPKSYQEADLTESQVEALILKYLLARGDSTGRQIAEQICLPFGMIDELLRQMKSEQTVVFKGAAPANDYIYQSTDVGRERARRHNLSCTYFGAAPVSLGDYIASVAAQSLEFQHPSSDDLKGAFSDLLIDPKMLLRLGPAINSGRGLFLYGAAGNGKTSIAERITKAFGEFVWIPKAIGVDGDFMRVFDPNHHEVAPTEESTGMLQTTKVDRRWIRIRRPTIVVGGELTMDNLEISVNSATGISEAPLQLKANCGTLLIDDFGRQRMTTDELLNRWIVPLEKRYDFLNLGSGKKIQVPFDELIVFSTNLDPRDLVDEAFLRRIPYKIEATDPCEADFRKLFEIMAPKLGFEFDQASVDHLIDTHYKPVERPYRNCQPRDLLLQVKNFCHYQKCKMEMTPEYFDFAVENYFSVM